MSEQTNIEWATPAGGPETVPLFQCECGAVCDGAGRVRPVTRHRGDGLGVLEPMTCERCVANPPRYEAPAVQRRAGGRGKVMRASGPPAELPACPRGCPDDSVSFDRLPPMAAAPEPVAAAVGSSQEEFQEHGDAQTQNEIIFRHLKKHFGEWQSIAVLEGISQSRRMNSRASEIRELAEVVANDWDVDQKNQPFAETGRLHSYYRLCAASESERLARQRGREESAPEAKG